MINWKGIQTQISYDLLTDNCGEKCMKFFKYIYHYNIMQGKV